MFSNDLVNRSLIDAARFRLPSGRFGLATPLDFRPLGEVLLEYFAIGFGESVDHLQNVCNGRLAHVNVLVLVGRYYLF